MRKLSFITAFAVFLIGPSLAGMPDGDLPGIGTFSYQGSPVITDAPAPMVMAAR